MGEIRTAWERVAQRLKGKGQHREKMGKVYIEKIWERFTQGQYVEG